MAKNKKKKIKKSCDQIRLENIKRKNKSGISSVKTNLFELKINKQKHAILNRKKKHHQGMPGVSRSVANKKREKTLLVEMNRKNNISVVKDKRIGAGDSTMSLDEKMLQRMTIERKRRHNKKQMYNLNDGDEEEEELTHLGKPLSSMDTLDNGGFSDDEGDDGRKGGEDPTNHFGGGLFSKKPEERTELEDIIAKSKLEKLERQQTKTQQEETFMRLENVVKQHHEVLSRLQLHQDEKDALKRADAGNSYAVLYNRMKMSSRSQAQRVKTADELAREEKEKQKNLLEERLRRMRGEKKEDTNKNKIKKTENSVDALCDEFNFEPIEANENEILSFPYAEEDDGDNDDVSDDDVDDDEAGADSDLDGNLILSDIEEEDEENGEEEDLSGSGDLGIYEDESISVRREDSNESVDNDSNDSDDDDDNFTDIDSGNEDSADIMSDDVIERLGSDDDEVISPRRTSNASKNSKLNFPESYSDFADLLDNTNDVTTADDVITKLHKQFAPNLGKGNKEKLAVLYDHVWNYCLKSTTKKDFQLNHLDPLIGHLHDLCQRNPQLCCESTRDNLQISYQQCFPQPDQLADYNPPWPAFKHLIQFKMIKHLFPTSDLRHPVSSPALIFMTQLLQKCRITSLKDISAGLFIVTICYEFICFSKRLLPECLNFLVCILATALNDKALYKKPALPLNERSKKENVKKEIEKALSSRSFTRRSHKLLVPTQPVDDVDDKIDLVATCGDVNDDDVTAADKLRRQLFDLSLNLLEKFMDIYGNDVCFPQLFAPHQVILKHLLPHNSSHHVLKSLYDVIMEKREVLQRMSFGKSKPAMIKMITPKFEESVGDPFSKRSKKTNSDKKELERLIHKKKQEMRGAIREIRKDSNFVAIHQLKQIEQDAEERRAKVKRIQGFLSDQQGEVRSIKRQKMKLDL